MYALQVIATITIKIFEQKHPQLQALDFQFSSMSHQNQQTQQIFWFQDNKDLNNF